MKKNLFCFITIIYFFIFTSCTSVAYLFMSDKEKIDNELQKITPAVLATIRFRDEVRYSYYNEKQLDKEDRGKFYFSLPDTKYLELSQEMVDRISNSIKQTFSEEGRIAFVEISETEKALKKYYNSQKVRKFFWPFLTENWFTEDGYDYSPSAFRKRYVTTDSNNNGIYKTTSENYRLIEPDKKLVRRLLTRTQSNAAIFFVVDFGVMKLHKDGFKAQVYGEVNMCIVTFFDTYFPMSWQCISSSISYRRFQENPDLALREIEAQIERSIEALVRTYLDSMVKTFEFR